MTALALILLVASVLTLAGWWLDHSRLVRANALARCDIQQLAKAAAYYREKFIAALEVLDPGMAVDLRKQIAAAVTRAQLDAIAEGRRG